MKVIQTTAFAEWLNALKDGAARVQILARIARLERGSFGDAKPVGRGITELRVHVGPGYRLYVLQSGPVTVVMLCGGDKSTQPKDIKLAHELAEIWRKRN